jgi:hypothetical protein
MTLYLVSTCGVVYVYIFVTHVCKSEGLPRNENELRSYISLSVALASSSNKDGDAQTKFVIVRGSPSA